MILESALKHLGPKGMSITDTSRATASDEITGTDVMAALGMAESKSEFGMALYLGKHGDSEEDKQRAIAMLTQFAFKNAPRAIKRASGAKFGGCLRIMALLAFNEFCRTAETTQTCHCCNGEGLINKKKEFKNQKAIDRQEYLDNLPGNLGWLYDNEMKVKKEGVEVVKVSCKICKGKGVLPARCRCQGTGETLDEKESKLRGIPVVKECPKCKGRGFKRVQPSVIYFAVKKKLPELPERTWRYTWKPFYESLLTKCYQEESHVEAVFKKITR
ncbi:TPA: antitermination protein [Yersinia enterocolitica]|nr:antitermination protein [Yersinia enterocolitica]